MATDTDSLTLYGLEKSSSEYITKVDTRGRKIKANLSVYASSEFIIELLVIALVTIYFSSFKYENGLEAFAKVTTIAFGFKKIFDNCKSVMV